MTFNPNDNIYKFNIPREYLLSNLSKFKDGTLRSGHDEKMIVLLDEGKTISEAIKLISHTAMFPFVVKEILCTRYFHIIKTYIHEYNLEKKRNRHNKETT